jgi:hypothetical protein
MRRLIKHSALLPLALSMTTQSADYETAQQLKDGDLLSADVLNDILSRIELTLKPITNEELIGDWRATQIVCNPFYAPDCAQSSAGFTFPTDNFGLREVEVSIQDNSDGTFQVITNQYNIFGYKVNSDNANNDACSIALGAILTCNTVNTGFIARTVNRRSDTQLTLSLPPDSNAGSGFSMTVLDKIIDLPRSPTDLKASLAPDGIMLTWEDNSDNESSFVVKRKTEINEGFAELTTLDADVVSFKDTSVLQNSTYWYRLGARNASGDSLYGKVIRQSFITS